MIWFYPEFSSRTVSSVQSEERPKSLGLVYETAAEAWNSMEMAIVAGIAESGREILDLEERLELARHSAGERCADLARLRDAKQAAEGVQARIDRAVASAKEGQ